MSLTFRPDVEGLRALAVIAVVLYHSGLTKYFSGGFVGVDIFFVISGFLITTNIRSDLDAGRFSFRDFYVRRIRRLFPALLATVTATLAIGVATASPAELVALAKSAIASVFSASNFFFWSESGYFDSSAIQKPLLHTWSLAVEEQFYLVWPALVVLVASRRNGRHAVALLAALVVAGTWASERALARDPSGAFYLAPYRVGEFAMGAICVWLRDTWATRRLVAETAVMLGLALMVYPVFAYSDATPFPGLRALIPCIGAALAILAGTWTNVTGPTTIEHERSLVAKWLLANPLAVGIGRISYSLYLTHWPIYVFQQQWLGPPSATATVAGWLLAVISAVGLHRFVEQPFRIGGRSAQAHQVSGSRFARLLAPATTLVVALAAAMWWGQGWWWRIPPQLVRFVRETGPESNERYRPFIERCGKAARAPCDVPSEAPNVFVLGDSHAPDAFNALVSAYPEFHYVLRALPACPPLVRADFKLLTAMTQTDRDACTTLNIDLLEGEALTRADMVVVSALYQWYGPPQLRRAVAQIRGQTSAPIIVLGNYLVFSENVPDMVLRHRSTAMNAFYTTKLDWSSFAFETELEALSKELQFTFVSKRRLFCRGDGLADCPLVIGDKLFTYDRHHLSLAAARALGEGLKTRYNRELSALGRAPSTTSDLATVATTGVGKVKEAGSAASEPQGAESERVRDLVSDAKAARRDTPPRSR